MVEIKKLALIMALVTIAFCVSCNNKTSEKPKILSPTSKERLTRAEQIEKWGFIEDAKRLYQLLTKSKSKKIAVKAYLKWANLTEKTGEKEKAAQIRQEICKKFSSLAPSQRRKLLDYHKQHWHWTQTKKITEIILTRDKPVDSSDLKGFIGLMQKWENRKVIWEEKFNGDLKWLPAHPYYFQVNSFNGSLNAVVATKTHYFAGHPLYFGGGSWVLNFDILPQDVTWASGVECGIYAPRKKNKITLNFDCSGGSGDYTYGLGFFISGAGKTTTIVNTLAQYKPGTLYKVEIDYLHELRQVYLKVKSEGAMVGKQLVQLEKRFPVDDYFIGLLPRDNSASNRVEISKVTVDNFQLRGSAWQKARQVPLLPLYKANLLALKNPNKAIEQFSSLAKKPQYSWRALEMRALLYKKQQKIGLYLNDLKSILKLNRQHINANDYIGEIKKYQKK